MRIKPIEIPNSKGSAAIGESASFIETKRRIVASAARVFSRRGFTAGTTKEIAAELQMSQPAVYHYIGSKNLLLEEIALKVVNDLSLSLEEGLKDSDNPTLRLRNVIRRFSDAVLRNQNECAVFWRERHSFTPELQAKVVAREREFMTTVSALIADLQKNDGLPKHLASGVLAEAIIGMPVWSYHWYRQNRHPDARALADLYCDLIGIP